MTRMRSLVRPLLTFVLLWLSYFLLNTVIGPSWVFAAILAAVLVVIALIDWARCRGKGDGEEADASTPASVAQVLLGCFCAEVVVRFAVPDADPCVRAHARAPRPRRRRRT